ncbi:MAG: DNA-directed RNA polymerase subunit F [Candidatus Diapherotrites archaeon]|nr:DNA-directed RNA polymerase subunit F [Candidatus Diapherotrites archaeon]
MIGKEVVQERDITLSEAKGHLQKRKKDSELSYEQASSLEYTSEFGKMSPTKARELIEKLMDVPKMDESTAVMIADIQPEDKDDLRVIMEKKRFKVEDKEAVKILDLVAQYSK